MQSQTLQLSVRLLVLLLALFMAFLLIGGPAEAEAPETGHVGPTIEYVVDSGDTLWGIAQRHVESSLDPRAVVLTIQNLNGLNGAVIHPGQVLLLPQG